ncbi:phospholipid carrier-dependent glycosyltransferase [Sandaracinomonas limnophila]|uniref:Phospholipid carrier-dependent glycosyltransferase n=1 Tax=Sandaracinomonas limnophila TaxID=1862386 RepID=A0A437PMK5_9BACT|nr:glycosyltransferase family 39 protein [Sandaracinomonas limnophila]RVU23513.1 phospholipid carrier-dependent glycosyltransferase [Sandaracinomonas limnophila]
MRSNSLKNVIYFGLFLCILLIAYLLRIKNLDTFSIGGDEFYTLLSSNYIYQEGGLQGFLNQPFFTNKDWLPSNSFSDLMSAMARRDNGSGLLFNILIHYWVKIFGYEDWGLRYFSVITNMGLLISVFYFCKNQLKSKLVGLLSIFLLAISPFLVSYSQVARTYSLVFLFSVLSSYYFLNCLKAEPSKKLKPFVIFGIVSLLTLMTHYSIFILFIFQFLFLLIFNWNNFKANFFKYLLAASFPILGMCLWLMSPGGLYSFHSIEVSKQFYNYVAQSGNGGEWLQVFSIKNVTLQLAKVISMSNLFFDRLAFDVFGKKNYLFTFLFIIGSAYSRKQDFFKNNPNFIIVLDIIFFILLSGFTSNHSISFLIIYLLGVLISTNFALLKPSNNAENYSIAIYLFSFLGLFLFAYLDGNTFRVMAKYAGYSYVFGSIFGSIFLVKVFETQNKDQKLLLTLLLICTTLSSVELVHNIYRDKMEPYFYSWSTPRTKNEYLLAKETILKNYQKGDTLIYPSFVFKPTKFDIETPHHSVQVAQYMNLYLHNVDQTIYQKIDTMNLDKIILQKPSGKKNIIYQFKNNLYLKDW